MHAMSRALVCVAVPGGLLVPVHGSAEEATVAGPDRYRVNFENDHVRVVRIQYGPHERSVMHDHNRDGLLVYLTDQRVKFTYPDGTSEEMSAKAGETGWAKAGTHLPENLGDTRLELLYIEIK